MSDATLKFNVDFSQVVSSVKNLEGLLGKIKVGGEVGKQLEQQLAGVAAKLLDLSKIQLGPDADPKDLKNYNNMMDQLKREVNEIAKGFTNVNKEIAYSTGLTKTQLKEAMNHKAINDGIENSYQRQKLALEEQLKAINAANTGIAKQRGRVASVNEAITEESKARTQAKLEEKQEYKDILAIEAQLVALEKERTRAKEAMGKRETLAVVHAEDLQNIKAIEKGVDDVKHKTDGLVVAAKGYTGALAESSDQATRTTATISSGLQDLSAKMQRLAQFTIAAFALRQMRQFFNENLKFVRELDKSLTEIATVTGKTRDEMWKMAEEFNRMGRELGKTTNEIVQASVIFYRQGLSTNQVLEMVRASTISAAIANTNAAEASNRLTAALRGYNMEAGQAMEVADKLAALAAKSASSFDELSYAIKLVA